MKPQLKKKLTNVEMIAKKHGKEIRKMLKNKRIKVTSQEIALG